jgi:hypothetical protein
MSHFINLDLLKVARNRLRNGEESTRDPLLDGIQRIPSSGGLRSRPRQGLRGELRINAKRWQINENQNTNEPVELQL